MGFQYDHSTRFQMFPTKDKSAQISNTMLMSTNNGKTFSYSTVGNLDYSKTKGYVQGAQVGLNGGITISNATNSDDAKGDTNTFTGGFSVGVVGVGLSVSISENGTYSVTVSPLGIGVGASTSGYSTTSW